MSKPGMILILIMLVLVLVTSALAAERDHVDQYIEDLNNAGSELYARESAAKALGNSAEDPRAVDALIAALKSKNPGIQGAAAEALRKIEDPKAVDALITVLKDDDPFARAAAAEALGRIEDPKAVDALIIVLKDETAIYAQAVAAEALSKIKDPKTVDALIIVLKDEDFGARIGAAEALGKIGDPNAVDALITALKDKYSGIRKEAAKALGKIKDPKAVDALITALKDDDKETRVNAANALGEIKDMRAVDALDKAISETEDKEEQEAFLDAFTEIFADYLIENIGKPKADKNDNATGQNQGDTDSTNDLSDKSGDGVEDGSSDVFKVPPGIMEGSIGIPSPPIGEFDAGTLDDQSGELEEDTADTIAGQDDAIIPSGQSREPEKETLDTTAGQDQGGVDPSKIDLSGVWYSVTAPSHEGYMGGSHPAYTVTGTDGHYEHKCKLTFDGTYYHGECLDTPGKCCNNQGELWILVVDGNSYKAKSRWWPKTESDKPPVTEEWLAGAGWETFERSQKPPLYPRAAGFDPTFAEPWMGDAPDDTSGGQVPRGPEPPQDPYKAGFDPEAAESGSGGAF